MTTATKIKRLTPVLPEQEVITRIEELNMLKTNQIFIPGEVPSKKNSQRIIVRKGTSKPMIIASEFAQRYKLQAGIYYRKYRNNFLRLTLGMPFPLQLSFRFYRRTKAGWDWINMMQTVQDMMVENKWIRDDDVTTMLPHPELPEYDPEMFGVVISLYGHR